MNQPASKEVQVASILLSQMENHKSCVTVTGISDFHKRTLVSWKSPTLKALPKIKTYRNYKTFHETRFNEDLKHKLDSI